MRLTTALVLLACIAALPAQGEVTRYQVGDAADVRPRLSGPMLMLGGGGGDVDSALQAAIDAVRGCADCDATLDVVVLRATGEDGYNEYIHAMHGVDSVETLVITARTDASDPAVVDTVARAELVFFAGGDQCNYVTRFKGTPLELAVEGVHARGGAIGGTSAGEAIQSTIVYDACTPESATSKAILADPWDRNAHFTTGFLEWPHMAATLAEQHTGKRDRMGRLMGFLARQFVDGTAHDALLGIAADEQSWILVDRHGLATVYGNGPGTGRAWFVLADHAPGVQELVQPGKPLTYRGYKIWAVTIGRHFDLAARDRNGPPTRIIDVVDGVLSANPY